MHGVALWSWPCVGRRVEKIGTRRLHIRHFTPASY
jgi:hypothetical protein